MNHESLEERWYSKEGLSESEEKARPVVTLLQTALLRLRKEDLLRAVQEIISFSFGSSHLTIINFFLRTANQTQEIYTSSSQTRSSLTASLF